MTFLHIKHKFIWSFSLQLLACVGLFCQTDTQTRRDSLLKIWNDSKADIDVRYLALDALVWKNYMYARPDSAIYYSLKMLEKAEKENLIKQQAWACNNLSVAFRLIGSYGRAIHYSSRNLEFQTQLNDPNGLASAQNNHGLIYYYMQNFYKAIEYFKLSLNEYDKTKNASGKALVLANIALVQTDLGDLERALKNTLRSLSIRDSIDDREGKAIALNNIGNILLTLGRIDDALSYFEDAKEHYLDINNVQGLANTINNIAAANLKANQLELAEQNARKALLLAKSTGTALEIKQASWILYQVFKKKLRFDKALEMFETYTMINDSILRVNNQNEILNNDYKAQFQLDSALAEENSRMLRLEINAQDAKIKQAQTEKLALFGGLGAGFIFSFLLYNRYKVAKKQKTIIEEKNSKLDLQNRQISIRQKEIADSIQYAKRLQDAMLPDMKRLNTLFGEFSLLYLPKDVVSGDFYWFEEKDGLLYLAVADCTGHGVPGAMVSMVCYNMLKRAVFEYNLFDPADILGKTRELVIDHFSQKDDSVNDGMDIALCCFDLNKMTLLFSGANMDLHIVTKSDHEKADVRRIKGNKQPVGVHMDQSDFQTHRIILNPGDRVILYSDGLTDQFGGSAGKKLKTSGLQRFIEKESFSEGNFERSLHQFIYDWKGNHEQVDDMCFVSVKVSHVRG